MQFKRGLSPVVATSLLVALAVILALIISFGQGLYRRAFGKRRAKH
jgi:flagellin-like protein